MDNEFRKTLEDAKAAQEILLKKQHEERTATVAARAKAISDAQEWLDAHILPVLERAKLGLSPDIMVEINPKAIASPAVSFLLRPSPTPNRSFQSTPQVVEITSDEFVQVKGGTRTPTPIGPMADPTTVGKFENYVKGRIKEIVQLHARP